MEVLASGDSVPIPASPIDVTEAAQLERVRSVVSAVSELAVDVEADSMHHFHARLCFVQLGTDHDIFLLDTLVPGVSPNALQDVFGNPAITKFFHAAQGDLQYLAEQGVRVRGLFDTHRAATLLNWPKVGLVDLVREKLGATLKKEHQQADFSIRPLPSELREYIADDVRYLCEVGRWVREACETAGILEEVQLDCDRMCDEAQARPDPIADFQPKLQRQGLTKEQFAVAWHSAHALHRKRMEWAEAEDVPMGRMLSNMALGALSTKHPTDLRQMVKLEGVRGAFVRTHGEEVMAMLAKIAADGLAGALAMPEEKRDRDPRRKKREEALMEWRKKIATERKVAPSVVLPNSLIADLSASPPESAEALANVPYFGAKRAGLYAEAVVGLLAPLR